MPAGAALALVWERTLKLRLLARRFSVSAPRMTVRRHVPWPLRAAAIAAIVVAAAGTAVWGWRVLVGDPALERQMLAEQVQGLTAQLANEAAERKRLQALVNSAASQTLVDKTTSERLAAQLRSLEAENAQVKADLAYLESLLPAAGGQGPIAIRRFEVQPDAAPRQMRYKALLMQTARSERGFDGTLQLVVNTRQGGKPGVLTVPPSTGASKGEGLPVSFRRYQRVEGMFEVPAGAVVTSVQIRVLEAGAVRAQQTVTM